MAYSEKGVYCIEGLWESDVRDKSTVLPILDVLKKRDICDYIYHDCATPEELVFFLDQWIKPQIQKKFPILYLAFHGDKECILLVDGTPITLQQLSSHLQGKCTGKVIYFASCLTLQGNGRKLQTFLENTEALAVIGYKISVDWIKSTALELLVLDALQADKFDSKGIIKIQQKLFTEYGNLPLKMQLRVVENKKIHFTRKRK